MGRSRKGIASFTYRLELDEPGSDWHFFSGGKDMTKRWEAYLNSSFIGPEKG